MPVLHDLSSYGLDESLRRWLKTPAALQVAIPANLMASNFTYAEISYRTRQGTTDNATVREIEAWFDDVTSRLSANVVRAELTHEWQHTTVIITGHTMELQLTLKVYLTMFIDEPSQIKAELENSGEPAKTS